MDNLTGANHNSRFVGDDDISTHQDLLLKKNDASIAKPVSSASPLDEVIISQALDLNDWVKDIDLYRGQETGKPAKPLAGSSSPEIKIPFKQSLKKIVRKLSGTQVTEIIEVQQENYDNKIFQGAWVDIPKQQDTFRSSTIEISGWVMAWETQPQIIRVVHQKSVVAEFPITVWREDVSAAYCRTSQTHFWGYSSIVDIKNLPSQGKLYIKAVFQENVEQFLSLIKFCRS